MTTTEKLITSQDPKGIDAAAKWCATYNKARLVDGPNGSAQRLNGSNVFWKELSLLIKKCSSTDQYINQVVKTNLTYPAEFQKKSVETRIKTLACKLGFDSTLALKYTESISGLPSILPEGCHPNDGDYAIVSPFGLQQLISGYKNPFDPELYCKGLLFLFDLIKKERNFYNCREGQIDKEHLQTEKTLETYEIIASGPQGKNPIWIITAQLGFLHKGESVLRAEELFLANEVGLGSVAGSSIAITDPDRFKRFEELDMDLPGDKFAPGADGVFSEAPRLGFDDDKLGFAAYDVSSRNEYFGSASGFLPKLLFC